jgi:hypothetical protein
MVWEAAKENHPMIKLTRSAASVAAFLLCVVQSQSFALLQNSAGSSAAPGGGLLERKYKEGEKLSYHLTTTNRGRANTLHYEIQADGVVKKDADGYVEEFAWSNMIVDGKPFVLPPSSLSLRQQLSLTPNAKIAIPDLSKVHPLMIGPITDMLSFYADLLIAKYRGNLTRTGDHFYFKHGTPNSWADGMHVTLGQDSIDFDVMLAEVDQAAKTATIVVKHVPPEKPQIKLPAAWMEKPVADTPNNWVEVTKIAEDKFSAEIGKEIFVDTIKISLVDGRIISATQENPVEVLERDCSDAALTTCGEPVRYRILRQIEIKQIIKDQAPSGASAGTGQVLRRRGVE